MTNGTYLTRDQILESDDLPTQDVPVPEWGGVVKIRMMTGADREAWEQSIAGDESKENVRAKFVARSIVGPDNQLLFSDDDVLALGRKSWAALDRVFKAALTLNAVQSVEVENLAKNFGTGPGAGSASS